MVKFFKKSSQAMECIEDYARRAAARQAQQGDVNKAKFVRLKQRGNTRWNSVYEMLHSVNLNRRTTFLFFLSFFLFFFP